MQDFITSKREEIAELCRRHHVRRLAVFGSAVRDDFNPARSDVDLLVEFGDVGPQLYFDNKTEFRKALTVVFGRKVDLLAASGIRNAIFRAEVEATQECLYAAA